MTQVMLAATFPKVVVNTTTGVVEVHSGLRDAVAREGLAAEEDARIAADVDLADAIAALDDSLAPAAKSGIAADVAFTPAGGISASDVQGAIEEAAAMSGGGGGEGDGDMLAAVYDPQDVAADAFDPMNHHGADWRLAVTPYDFAEGVGVGNSTKDTEAMLAFAAEITANDAGKAEIIGNFLLEEGVVFGPDAGNIATGLIVCNANIASVAPIDNLVTFRRFTGGRLVGRLHAQGTGGSSLASNTAIHGIRLDRCGRADFDTLRATNFRGWGIRNVSSNDHFLKIGKVRATDCGASAQSTRTFPVTVTNFDKTGSATIYQRSVLTVDDPANLPSAAHELHWGFIIVNGFPHKIVEVDYSLGTLAVYPWLATADEVPGEFQLVFGGGLRLGGQSAKSVVGSIDTIRTGTGLWVHGAGAPVVIGHGSQFDGVSIALGTNPHNAFDGMALMGGYWEAQAVANLVHVSQTSSFSNGSTITGITSLSLPAVFSLRPRATGGVVTASRYFPVELVVNNRRWNVESEDDVWTASDVRTNYTLRNIPLPWTPHRSPSASTFTLNLLDDPDYRRLKGSVPVSFILSGRGDRKGDDLGYDGTVVINALDDGYTINDSAFQSVEFTGPEKPIRITAWLADYGAGLSWMVTVEEIPLAVGTESSPVFPGDIDDLAVVSESGDSLTVEFTEATNADHYEYHISLAGSGAWGGAETLPGSADEGTFAGDIDGLAENETYDVQVRGQNSNGPGEWSNIATGTTVAFPGTIDDLDVIATTETSATLRFTEPLDPFDADSYEVRFKLSSAGEWGAEAAFDGSSSGGMFTGAVTSGLTTDEEHDFQVRGINDNGEGEWSNTATATVQAPPAWQQLLTLVAAVDPNASVYDPDNPNTWTPRESGGTSFYTALTDGMENQDGLAQATEATQPDQVTLSTGRRVMARTGGALRRLAMATTDGFDPEITQPNTVLCVARPGTTSNEETVFDNNVGSRQILRFRAAGNIGMWAGSFLNGGTSATELAIIQANYNGASSELFVNGTSVATGNAGSNGLARLRGVMSRSDDSGPMLDGALVGPIIVFPGLKTNAETADIRAFLAEHYPPGA